MEGQSSGTPFMIAGYLLTWIVLAWYVWRLNRRASDVRRALEGARPPHAEIEDAEPNE